MAKPSRPAEPSPENRLLAALPRPEFDRLTARMKNMSFAVRDVLYQAHGPIPHVYFPRSGVVSMVVTAEEGGMIEVGTVGREGMAGVPALLGATGVRPTRSGRSARARRGECRWQRSARRSSATAPSAPCCSGTPSP